MTAILVVIITGISKKDVSYDMKIKNLKEMIVDSQKGLVDKKMNAVTFFELSKEYKNRGDTAEAIKYIRSAMVSDPANGAYRWFLAKLLAANDRAEESLKCYRDTIQLIPTGKIPLEMMKDKIFLMWDMSYLHEAKIWMASLWKEYRDNAGFLQLYALCCERDFDLEKAEKLLKESLRIDPEFLPAHYAMAAILKYAGNKEASMEHYRFIISRDRYAADAYRMFGEMHQYSSKDALYKDLIAIEKQYKQLTEKQKVDLHFALGKALDDTGDLEKSFWHYGEGGRIHLKNKTSETSNMKYLLDYMVHNTTVNSLESIRLEEFSEKIKPLFIVGMPRSGTSLAEQVLSVMPSVFAGGEIPYLNVAIDNLKLGQKKISTSSRHMFSKSDRQSLHERTAYYRNQQERIASADSEVFIDKLPTNFQWLGAIYALFPDASIIHMRRHPVEICLSAYRLHFTDGQLWSYDLKDMGRYYRLYHELMLHWKSILPEGTILDVRYEDMVNDLEGESKRIAQYIGIPWSEKCLEFHKSKSAVRTASLSQVRQPLYETSMNRWRKYEPYLKPLLDEIGDLVEAYEAELNESHRVQCH